MAETFDEQDAWDDDRKPRTEAEMEARTLWQSGDMWRVSGERYGRARGKGDAVAGDGPWASMVRATVGHDGAGHVRAVLSSDPRVFGAKRRARTRDFFRPPAASPDYRHALPFRDVVRLYDAGAYANRRGVVLNARVTISWFLLGDCTERECERYFEAFKKNVVEWLRSRGAAAPGKPFPAYVYAHEAAGGNKRHTHMRLAVPPELGKEFREEVRAALRHVIAPRPWPELAVGPDDKEKSRFVVARVSAVPAHDPARSRPMTKDQWIGVTYMLKGADPTPALSVREGGQTVSVGDIMEWEYEDPGAPWTTRRVGASQELGPTARRAFVDEGGHAFHSLLTVQRKAGTIDVRDLYSDYYLDQAAGRRGVAPPAAPQPGTAADGEDVVAALLSLSDEF